ncbi:hypothetical protein GQ43DRAFT_497107 [Delitschia confertaspora ATCC 74209]|uniref:Uncharacterized protein n=1 Tax=Delitschia confertaspora ATCC 74209 TaxID=1513339 RepID=A0A9P4MLG5_9PLEO|nr:hypothetical protein GQ43DRAFT_497107 [Delitschia confertaspora ATCC 74209]
MAPPKHTRHRPLNIIYLDAPTFALLFSLSQATERGRVRFNIFYRSLHPSNRSFLMQEREAEIAKPNRPTWFSQLSWESGEKMFRELLQSREGTLLMEELISENREYDRDDEDDYRIMVDQNASHKEAGDADTQDAESAMKSLSQVPEAIQTNTQDPSAPKRKLSAEYSTALLLKRQKIHNGIDVPQAQKLLYKWEALGSKIENEKDEQLACPECFEQFFKELKQTSHARDSSLTMIETEFKESFSERVGSLSNRTQSADVEVSDQAFAPFVSPEEITTKSGPAEQNSSPAPYHAQNAIMVDKVTVVKSHNNVSAAVAQPTTEETTVGGPQKDGAVAYTQPTTEEVISATPLSDAPDVEAQDNSSAGNPIDLETHDDVMAAWFTGSSPLSSPASSPRISPLVNASAIQGLTPALQPKNTTNLENPDGAMAAWFTGSSPLSSPETSPRLSSSVNASILPDSTHVLHQSTVLRLPFRTERGKCRFKEVVENLERPGKKSEKPTKKPTKNPVNGRPKNPAEERAEKTATNPAEKSAEKLVKKPVKATKTQRLRGNKRLEEALSDGNTEAQDLTPSKQASFSKNFALPHPDQAQFGLPYENFSTSNIWALLVTAKIFSIRQTLSGKRYTITLAGSQSIAQDFLAKWPTCASFTRAPAKQIDHILRPLDPATGYKKFKRNKLYLKVHHSGVLVPENSGAKNLNLTYELKDFSYKFQNTIWSDGKTPAAADVDKLLALAKSLDKDGDSYITDVFRIFAVDRLSRPSKCPKSQPDDPEWAKVLPQDQTLRAYLEWMSVKEGDIWDPLTGRFEEVG